MFAATSSRRLLAANPLASLARSFDAEAFEAGDEVAMQAALTRADLALHRVGVDV